MPMNIPPLKVSVPDALAEGNVLVIAHEPSVLMVTVKKVHGNFAGFGWLVETNEGNLCVVRGWLGYVANIIFFPFNTTLEAAIARYHRPEA